MTTFKEFLTEDNQVSVKQAINLIKRQCKPFLSESHKIPLYRGMNSYKDGAYVLDVRKDRKPRDSAIIVHNTMNLWFEKHFGVKFRSESVFTTASRATAARYGYPFFVFPIGKFKYVWATKYYEDDNSELTIQDTISVANHIDHVVKKAKEQRKKVTIDMIDHIMNGEFRWKDYNLHQALMEDAEISIACDKFIAIRATPENEELLSNAGLIE